MGTAWKTLKRLRNVPLPTPTKKGCQYVLTGCHMSER